VPSQSLCPRFYLTTDRDPSRNLGAPQVTILDPTTLALLFSTTAGDDAVLSADQKHLYVVSTSQITAIDVVNQSELWRLALDHRLAYIGGAGPTSLALAPDGSELYVLSYNGGDSSGPYWLQVVDTATGLLRPKTVLLSSCVDSAPRFLSPGSGDRVYVVCSWSVLAINTRSQVVERTNSLLALTGQMVDAVLSRDGALIYIATRNRELAVLDIATGALNPHATAARPPDVTGDPGYGGLALSADGNTLLTLDTVQSQPGTDVAADLYFYDTRMFAPLRHVRVDRPLQSTALGISPDGRTIFSATGPADNMPFGADTLVEIDATTGAITAEHPRPGEHILRMWLMPGGR
jgi:DNA-binding beta-propeller fold protein YncE